MSRCVSQAFARGCRPSQHRAYDPNLRPQVNDISLEDYIAVKVKSAQFVPHTAGRFQTKRFRKAQCPIVERLVNSLMMHGRNNGKKLLADNIVKHAFEIIHLLTDQNPIQASGPAPFCSLLLGPPLRNPAAPRATGCGGRRDQRRPP